MPLANRRAEKTIAIVFQIRLQLVSWLRRTGNEYFFKMAGGKGKHIEFTEESGRTGIFAKDKAEIKDKGQQK